MPKTGPLPWIRNQLDAQLPRGLKKADGNLRRRARLCVSLPLICAFGASVALAAQLTLGRPASALVTTSVGVVTSLLCSRALKWTGSVELAAQLTTALVFTLVSINTVLVGGVGSPRAYAIGIVPLIAVLLLGSRRGALWALVCVAEVAALWVLRQLGPGLLPPLPQTHVVTAHTLGVGLLVLVGWLVLHSYDRAHAAVTAELARERRDAEAARETAQQASRLKSALVANVSHELRTPLHGILGSAELLAGVRLDDAGREHVGTITEAGETLLRLVDDLLDKSRLEAGGMELEATGFGLRRTLGAVVRPLAPIAQRLTRARVVLHVDPDVPDALVGDPFRLRQVLTNLANNAIKFTPDGHIVLRVSAPQPPSIDAAEVTVRFEVIDSGVGIARDQLDRLFEAFEQAHTHTARAHGGAGLGLDIARQLVRLMGSDIEVESEPGRGTRFWFDLRLRRGAQVTSEERFEAVRVRLELEDPTEAAAVEAALTWCGHHVTAEAGGDVLVHDGPSRVAEPGVHIVDSSEIADGETEAVRLARPFGPVGLAEAIARSVERETEPRDALEVGRVLVVDDARLNRRVLRAQLESLGYDVVAASDVDSALDTLRADAGFVAVFLDIMMPGRDGYDAARAIRELEVGTRRPSCSLFAVSGHQSSEHRRRAAEAGFDRFLVKPLRTDDLAAILTSRGRRRALPVVNETAWSDLETLAGGDESFLREIVASFLATAEERVARLERGEALEETAHALAGAAAQIGAVALARACRALEDDPSRHEELSPRVLEELRRASDDLTRRVSKPEPPAA